MRKRWVRLVAVLACGLGAAVLTTGTSVASAAGSAGSTQTTAVTSSSLGTFSPTFVGSAATGCNNPGCSLLTGPFFSPSTADVPATDPATASALSGATAKTLGGEVMPSPVVRHSDPVVTPPSVSCRPVGPGCDLISSSSGGATGVKGLNAVDSASLSTNPLGDIEPADQGLCAGNGYVVETNNIGEILVFNTALHRRSSPIPLDTLMGLTNLGWTSGGDPSCLYDYSDGGHWFFTEFVSTNTAASGGPFTGCFAGAANTCYEGIAVTQGSNPFGPYNVYFLNANYNPSEPGAPYLLNDFAKIGATQDAFLLFYDEFAQKGGGLAGGFNGAQEFAINKDALEEGLSVTLHHGKPNPLFTVAIENMGLLSTPDGPCNTTVGACWYQVIPAQAPDPSQFDNSHDGSGFMLASLDFFGHGDNRIAVFDWTGLANLNSPNCVKCAGIKFGGQLFSGVQFYYGEGQLGAQKAGPTPLADICDDLPGTPPPPCTEGGIATNGDGMTQVSQAQDQLWGAIATEVNQTFSGASPEIHQGFAYWVIGTRSFDRFGVFSLTNQQYVSAAHEDLEFPAIAATGDSDHGDGYFDQDGGHGTAIMTFTLSGNGGPSGADNGGFYPSTAFGRLTSDSNGLSKSVMNVADLGQSPQDGFTEYESALTPPRWGDYSWAIYVPWSGGRVYFATNYIQYPNCADSAFTLTIGTCGGTRDGLANWGTSVNYVVP